MWHGQRCRWCALLYDPQQLSNWKAAEIQEIGVGAAIELASFSVKLHCTLQVLPHLITRQGGRQGNPWQGSGHSWLCCVLPAFSSCVAIITDTGITGLNILATHMLYITVYAQLRASRHMCTPTQVAAFLKRRNITPPFQIDRTADCSLYPCCKCGTFSN